MIDQKIPQPFRWLIKNFIDLSTIFLSVVLLGLYEAEVIGNEAIGRYILLVLGLIGLSNLTNRGPFIADYITAKVDENTKKVNESANLIHNHLDGDVLEKTIAGAIDVRMESVEDQRTAGIKKTLPSFDAKELTERARRTQKSIRILQTYSGMIDQLTEPLREAASRGVNIRILFLNPDSKQAWYRSMDLFKFIDEPTKSRNPVRANIINELETLAGLLEEEGLKDYVEMRVYDATPTISLYGFDDVNVLGVYWRKLAAIAGTQFEISASILDIENLRLARAVHEHFEDLWEMAAKPTSTLWTDPGEVSSPPAVEGLQAAIEQGLEKFRDSPGQMAEFVRQQVHKLPELEAVVPAPAQLDLGKHSILWVDDNPTNNAVEMKMLDSLKATVWEAVSTKDALKVLGKGRSEGSFVDAIISDLNRKEEDQINPDAGHELFDALQNDSSYKEVPFIFYTGNADDVDPERGAAAYGVADRPDKLIELVISALQFREGPREVA
jgi:CheY-like chemotaxis protein